MSGRREVKLYSNIDYLRRKKAATREKWGFLYSKFLRTPYKEIFRNKRTLCIQTFKKAMVEWRFPKALSIVNRALITFSKDAYLYHLRGLACHWQMDFEEAAWNWKMATRCERNHATRAKYFHNLRRLYISWANFNYVQGEYMAALDFYRAGASICYNHELEIQMTECMYRLKMEEIFTRDYGNRIVQPVSIDNVHLVMLKARFLYRRSVYGDARKLMVLISYQFPLSKSAKDMIKLVDMRAEEYHLNSVQWHLLGMPWKAVNNAHCAIECCPDRAKYYVMKGILLRLVGKPDLAEKSLLEGQTALKADKPVFDVGSAEETEFKEKQNAIEKTIIEQIFLLHHEHGVHALENHNVIESMCTVTLLRNMGGNWPETRVTLADCLAIQGKFVEALDLYMSAHTDLLGTPRAKQVSTRIAALLQRLATVALQDGKYLEAINMCSKAIKYAGPSAMLLVLKARAKHMVKPQTIIDEDLKAALEMNPGNRAVEALREVIQTNLASRVTYEK